MTTKRVKTIAVIFAVICFAHAAVAQTGGSSRITGNVQDKNGSVIAGATVTLTNDGTNVSQKTTTSNGGVYTFTNIPIGQYSITVEAKGFKKYVSSNNNVDIGQPATVNVTMTVGAAGEQVNVEATAEIVQTSTAGNVGNIVDEAQIRTLPNVGSRGRNPLNFVNFQPGVVNTDAAGGDVHVNGSRDRAWNFTLDGIDNNETSAGGSNFAPLRTNPDSISEFKVITNGFTAEQGRNSGGQVTMVTKSGTNQFHGSGFWFYQTPLITANDVINKVNNIPKPQFVQNLYGGSVGGPIFKNKLFFFTNVQLDHTRRSKIAQSLVYTQLARQGMFRYVTTGRNLNAGVAGASVDAQGNVLAGITFNTYNVVANDPLAKGIDPTIAALLARTPLPNDFTTGGDGLNVAFYDFTAPEIERQVDETVKVDWNLSQNHKISGRWASGHQNTLGDLVNGGAPVLPGFPNVVDTVRQPRNFAGNWTWIMSPSMSNEMIIGMNRFGFDFRNPDPNFATNPAFAFNNVAQPLQNYIGNARFLSTLQLVDNWAKVSGSHTWKAGINFRYGREIDKRGSIGNLDAEPAMDFSVGTNSVGPAYNVPSSNINTTFDVPRLRNTINDLLGRIGGVNQGFVQIKGQDAYAPGGTILNFDSRFPEYDFYGQDTWKWRPNLTFEYGLRWDVRIAPNAHGYPILIPNQPFIVGAAPSTNLKWVPGSLFKSDWKNFGPNVGIAWDPFKDGKTSVRAYYRLAYDRLNTFSFSSGIFQGLPGETAQIINNSYGTSGCGGGECRLSNGLPNLTPTLTPGAFTTPPSSGASFSGTTSITVVDPNIVTPKTHQWGLSLQQEVFKNTVVELNYIGRHGSNLYGGYDANQVNILATTPTTGAETFLQAFNTVKSGGDSPLMNLLMTADSRRLAGESGSTEIRRLFASTLNLNSVAALAASIGQRTQGGASLLVLDGLPQTLFQRYPQFGGGLNVLDTNDWSNYHALQVQLSHRYSGGLSYQFSYTWAKSLDTRSFDPTFTRVGRGTSQSASATPFDITNRRLNYARSDFDRRHALQGAWVYELPFGKNKRWFGSANESLDRIVNGWEFSGILNLSSGRPFTVYSGSNTYSNVVSSPAQCNSGCSSDMGHITVDPVSGNPYLFDAGTRNLFSAPAAGALGNTGRNAFDLPHYFDMDVAFGKKTRVFETQTLEMRFEMQNAFNTVLYSLAESSTITSGVFARERGAGGNSARRCQIVLKYSF